MRTFAIAAATMGVLLTASGTASAAEDRPREKDEKAGTPSPAEKAEAEQPPEGGLVGVEADAEAAAPEIPHLVGPQRVDLGHNIEIDLPAGAWLYEQEVTRKLIETSGGDASNALAIVEREGADWQVLLSYDDSGHVTDDDADELDADDLLDSYKEGTKEQNKVRVKMGLPELFVDAWSEKPHYERAHRRLRWGLRVHDTDGPAINYFTRILGREAVLEVNLIADPEKLEAAKTASADILAAAGFKAGARYEDFDESTDKSAGYGLAGLVLGGTAIAKAAKAGLFIKLLLILKKGWIVLALAIGAFFRKLKNRAKDAVGMDTTAAEAAPADPSPPADT